MQSSSIRDPILKSVVNDGVERGIQGLHYQHAAYNQGFDKLTAWRLQLFAS